MNEAVEVVVGFRQNPAAERGLALRRLIRRSQVGTAFADEARGPYPLDQLTDASPSLVAGFRPRLAEESRLEGNSLLRETFVIRLDPWELAALRLSDGTLTVSAISAQVAPLMTNVEDPAAALVGLLEGVARYEMLAPGAQAR